MPRIVSLLPSTTEIAVRLGLEDQLVGLDAQPVELQPDTADSPSASTSTTTGGRRPTDGLEPQAGPPFPDAINTVAVYDYAKVISPDVITRLDNSIDTIEERTGAEIVIYTQFKPSADSAGATEADAIALIDQWGVGRQGFDERRMPVAEAIDGPPLNKI